MRPVAASLVLRGIAVVLGGVGLTPLALGVSKAMAVEPASVAAASTSPAATASLNIAWTIAGA